MQTRPNRWNDDFDRVITPCELPRIRWSLRTLIVVTGISAVVAAGIGFVARRNHMSKEFSSLGCAKMWTSPRPIGWSRQFGVAFNGEGINDNSIRRAMRLCDSLWLAHETVCLNRVAVTRKGLLELTRWRDARCLFVTESEISREDVFLLMAECPHLAYLDVNNVVYKDDVTQN